MLSFKSFSQNDTVSTTIQLSKPIAKLVVTDLISGDQAKIEVKTLGELIAELEKKNKELQQPKKQQKVIEINLI